MVARPGKELDRYDAQEDKGKAVFASWLESRGNTVTDANLDQQLRGIDLVVTRRDGSETTVELKSDGTNHTGSIFAEQWADTRRNKVGWLMTCEADRLAWIWTETNEAISFDPRELKEAIFEDGLCRKLKTVTTQTWQCTSGFSVPVSELAKLKSYRSHGKLIPPQSTVHEGKN